MVWKMVGNNVNYIKFVVNGIKDEKLLVWFFKAANNEARFVTKLAGGNGYIQYRWTCKSDTLLDSGAKKNINELGCALVFFFFLPPCMMLSYLHTTPCTGLPNEPYVAVLIVHLIPCYSLFPKSWSARWQWSSSVTCCVSFPWQAVV